MLARRNDDNEDYRIYGLTFGGNIMETSGSYPRKAGGRTSHIITPSQWWNAMNSQFISIVVRNSRVRAIAASGENWLCLQALSPSTVHNAWSGLALIRPQPTGRAGGSSWTQCCFSGWRFRCRKELCLRQPAARR